jgi:hypothetical protein
VGVAGSAAEPIAADLALVDTVMTGVMADVGVTGPAVDMVLVGEDAVMGDEGDTPPILLVVLGKQDRFGEDCVAVTTATEGGRGGTAGTEYVGGDEEARSEAVDEVGERESEDGGIQV